MTKHPVTLKFNWFGKIIPIAASVCFLSFVAWNVYAIISGLIQIKVIGYCFFGVIDLIIIAFAIRIVKRSLRNVNRKILIDEEGIKTDEYTVAWSDVTSVRYFYVANERDVPRNYRVLIIRARDRKSYEEIISDFRCNKHELINVINDFAGRKVFNSKCLLQERHERLQGNIILLCCLPSVLVISLRLLSDKMTVLFFFLNIMLSILVQIIVMKRWRKRHNYKD